MLATPWAVQPLSTFSPPGLLEPSELVTCVLLSMALEGSVELWLHQPCGKVGGEVPV